MHKLLSVDSVSKSLMLAREKLRSDISPVHHGIAITFHVPGTSLPWGEVPFALIKRRVCASV